MLPDSEETKCVSRDQEVYPSGGKNPGGGFSAMFAHGRASIQPFPMVLTSLRSPGVLFYDR